MKILFILTSHSQKGNTGEKTGFHLGETTHVHKVLCDASYEIEFASTEGGAAPLDHLDLTDPLNKEFMDNPKFSQQIQKTIQVDNINPSDYIAVYFPGGHGTMWDLPENKKIQEIISKVYDKGGIIAAVCHGPAALINAKLPDGSYLIQSKNVSCFTNEEEAEIKADKFLPFALETKLAERGAKIRKSANFAEHVEVDERLITGQNPASAKKTGEEMVKLLTSICHHHHDHFDDDDDLVTSPRSCC